MFDSFTVVNRVNKTEINEIRLNSVGGTLVRSHENSIITKVIPDTDLEKHIFNIECPHYKVYSTEYYNTDAMGNRSENGRHTRSKEVSKTYKVEVLQVMLCGDFMMVEFILVGEYNGIYS